MEQNMQNRTISELYNDDKKSKHFSNPNDILSQLKALIKNFIYKTAIAELFSKISNTKKISNKPFHHCEANMFLEEVTKSINSQANIKSSVNDSLTAKFYKQLSNELSFNVYQQYPI